ncbi:DUF551 domain-containing protein [Escherichia coli]|uniref:DUF551 domain-containing protein n=1 Tax=Escherichia coli TaxID=562 RepID=UPI0033965787
MKGEVKERGMIFNDEMVRAILEGRKTQTRRIMKNQPAEVGPEAPVMVRKIGAGFQWYGADGVSSVFNCPFGIVGDRIWVRETWAILGNEDGCSVDWNDNLCRGDEKSAARIYRASCEQKPGDYGLWSITPDGWISCSERMPAQDDWILIYSKHGEYMAGQVQEEYVELSDGTLSWLGNALFWMPLPEPPQEAK